MSSKLQPHAQESSLDDELLALEARVGQRRVLLTDRIDAFVNRWHGARELTRGNTMLVVLDYLIRYDDTLAHAARADFDAVHDLVDALIRTDSALPLARPPAGSPLAGAFAVLADLATDDYFPRVVCHGNIILPDVICDAAALDIAAPLMGERQACRIVSRSDSLAHVPMSVLAAARPALLRLLGVDDVMARMGSVRSADEIQRDMDAASSTLERMIDLARVLDIHLDALDDVLAQQGQVFSWMVEGLEALIRIRLENDETAAPPRVHKLGASDDEWHAVLGRQRAALHHYAVIFELRYHHIKAAQAGGQIDKYRSMHRVRHRTPLDLSIKRIASYYCVAMRYSPSMRGSTRLHTLDDSDAGMAIAR